MRTGFKNRPGVTYDADQLDRFYAEDIQAVADFINGFPAGHYISGPAVSVANSLAFFIGTTGQSLGSSGIVMPIPGDLYSEGSLQFDGGLTSDYFHVGKQMIINGAQSNDLEGLMGMSNVESGRRVGVIQSFENGSGEFSFLTLVNRGLNGSEYVLLDNTSKKGAQLQISSNPDYLLKLATFAANSTTLSSVFSITHAGYVCVGSNIPLNRFVISNYAGTIPTVVTTVHLVGADSENTAMILDSIGNQCNIGVRRADGTHASKSAILADENIGTFSMSGYNGSAYTNSRGGYKMNSAENWTTTANGTYITFNTTEKGTATVGGTIRVRIDHNGNVGIGTTPDANALLDVSSTTKAVLFPRMTTTQRDAIASPVEGMLIYNTTTHVFNFRNNSAWAAI